MRSVFIYVTLWSPSEFFLPFHWSQYRRLEITLISCILILFTELNANMRVMIMVHMSLLRLLCSCRRGITAEMHGLVFGSQPPSWKGVIIIADRWAVGKDKRRKLGDGKSLKDKCGYLAISSICWYVVNKNLSINVIPSIHLSIFYRQCLSFPALELHWFSPVIQKKKKEIGGE